MNQSHELITMPYGGATSLPTASHPIAVRPRPIPPHFALNEQDRANLAVIFSAALHPHTALKGRALAAGLNVAMGEDELHAIDMYINAWEVGYFAEAVDKVSAMALGAAPLIRYLYLFQLRENVRVAYVPNAPILESSFLARLRNQPTHKD